MEAKDTPFSHMIQGNKQFQIPVFQRDYRWTDVQCSQLWDDLLRNGSSGAQRGHFIGSIVYMAAASHIGAAFSRWLIVDGQQRLTSLTLLMVALRDHIAALGWTGGEDSPTPERIDAYFLRNTEESEQRKRKLVLRRGDDETLRALVDRTEMPETRSALVRDAYDRFRELLSGCDPDMVYEEVSRLVVVDVTLDRQHDDPQLVFESLNSTGIDLEPNDLVRNYLLMGLPESTQTELYEKYWSRVERMFNGSTEGLNSFLRDYIAVETEAIRQVRYDQIYEEFKKTFHRSNTNGDIEQLMSSLARAAKHYASFFVRPQDGGDDDWLAVALRRLRQRSDAVALLVMCLYDRFDRGTLVRADFIVALRLIESYLVRRAACGLQSRNYWSVFAAVALRLGNNRPLVDLKVAFARLGQDTYRFPSDASFTRALVQEDLYSRRSICLFLLKQLENYGQKEPSAVDTYTIEHIMPQTVSDAWQEMLGSEWGRVHETWLHRLANLTLTAYNSEYSNRTFSEKKSIAGGFRDSAVRLNGYVREQDRWTEAEMSERGDLLAARAIEAWSCLDVDALLIEEAEVRDLQARASSRGPEDLPMSRPAGALFRLLDPRIRGLREDFIVTVERRSIGYYVGSTVVLEVLPQQWGVRLLLDIDLGEVADPEGLARDANDWKFIPNAAFPGWNLLVEVWQAEQIAAAISIVRQSIDLE